MTTPDNAARAFLKARADAQATPREFPPLIPFGSEARPEFPTDLLPYTLARWSAAATVAYQVPPDLPALLSLAALSTACGGVFVVKVRDGWVEPTNLYVVAVLEPASRKSAVFSAASKPVSRWEARERTAQDPDRRREQDAHDVAKKRVESAKKGLAAASNDESRKAAQVAYDEAFTALEKSPPPRAALRLLADDVTPEKLAILMAEQGGRLSVLSAEGGLLGTLLGKRYSRNGEPSLDIVLKAHAGDSVSVDRIGREPVHLPRPALTIGLALQPEVLFGLGQDRALRGRGVLARFLFGVPRPTVGHREIASKAIPPDAVKAYEAMIETLLNASIQREESGTIKPTELVFTRDADLALQDFERELEPRLAEDGDLHGIADWAGKLAGATVRIAALLHAAEAAAEGREVPLNVEASVVRSAISVAPYLIAHARAAFSEMAEPDKVAVARRVIAWIERAQKSEISERDLLRALAGGRAKVEKIEDLRDPLRLLVERGYIVAIEDEARSGPGRPRSPSYAVNPAVFEKRVYGSSDKSDKTPGGEGVLSDLSEQVDAPEDGNDWTASL